MKSNRILKQDHAVPTVDEIQTLNVQGPWDTKSGGKLRVPLAMPPAVQEQYFLYDKDELKKLPSDIRGFRIYTVLDLPQGSIGGREWHRVRQEIVFVIKGSVRWICEDLLGNCRNFVLDSNNGIWMPPFILHTYKVTEEGSELLVIANTLFPDDPKAHDTYSIQEFRELQEEKTS